MKPQDSENSTATTGPGRIIPGRTGCRRGIPAPGLVVRRGMPGSASLTGADRATFKPLCRRLH